MKSQIRQALAENGSTFAQNTNGWTLVHRIEDLPKEVAKWAGSPTKSKQQNGSHSEFLPKLDDNISLPNTIS